MYDYQLLSSNLNILIEHLEAILPEDVIANAKEYVAYREYGIALEYLCEVLCENDIAVSPPIYNQITHVGSRMNLSKTTWLLLTQAESPNDLVT